MSFVKCLKCYICSKIFSIEDVDFPDDLYDLVLSYKVDQLVWLCRTCKNDFDQNLSKIPPVLNKIKNSEESVINLNSCSGNLEDCQINIGITRDAPRDCQNYELINAFDKLECSDNEVTTFYSLSETEVSSPSSSPTPSQSSSLITPTPSKRESRFGVKYVQEILNVIKMDPVEETECKKIVQSVITELLYRLKSDEQFQSLFHKFYYTGSSYNDLRIMSPTEYDLNLILRLKKGIELSAAFHGNCSFAKLRWEVQKENDNLSLPVKFLEKNSCDMYLLPDKVLSWLQSKITCALGDGFKLPPGVLGVTCVKNGPAHTIVVDTDMKCPISIDIVPVFEFDYSVIHDTAVFDKIPKTGDKNKDKWFMVPKVIEGQVDIPYKDAAYYWRCDYPNAEKQILSGKECAKSVIKVLKIFRDKRDWKLLASYFLKMVVILEIKKNPNEEFWKNGNLFQRLMDAFIELKNYLHKHCLPHFLTHQNLLYKFNPDHCKNWYNYLKNAISIIELQPDRLMKYLQ